MLILFYLPRVSCLRFGLAFCSPLLAAHKRYPVRACLVNIEAGDAEWFSVVYFPIFQRLKETSADKRGKQRRGGVLQRVLYMAFRTAIQASHAGVKIDGGACGKVLAFLRILPYVCDQREERAVLRLKTGSFHRPGS